MGREVQILALYNTLQMKCQKLHGGNDVLVENSHTTPNGSPNTFIGIVSKKFAM